MRTPAAGSLAAANGGFEAIFWIPETPGFRR
jgi:hypothetical protein